MVQETLFGPTLRKGQIITVPAYCLEPNRSFILILKGPTFDVYHRAHGLDDILPEERKDEVLECIKKTKI